MKNSPSIFTLSLLIALLLCPVSSNLWDNVFSRLNTTHRIIIPQEDEFQLHYRRSLSTYVFSVAFSRLQSTLSLQLDMQLALIFRQPIFSLLMELQGHTLQLHTGSEKCTIVKLPTNITFVSQESLSYTVPLQQAGETSTHIETLVPLITKFRQRTKQGLYEYKVDPKILGSQTLLRRIQEFRIKSESAQNNLQEQQNKRMLQMIPFPREFSLLGKNDDDDDQLERIIMGGLKPEDDDGDMMSNSFGMFNPFQLATDSLTGQSVKDIAESEVFLQFDENFLKRIRVNKKYFDVKRVKTQISWRKKECHEEDWSDKTLAQIMDSLEYLITGAV